MPLAKPHFCDLFDAPRMIGTRGDAHALAISRACSNNLLRGCALDSAQATPDLRATIASLECPAKRIWPLFKGHTTWPDRALLLSALALSDDDRHAATDSAEFARARAIFHGLAQTPARRPPALRKRAASQHRAKYVAAKREPVAVKPGSATRKHFAARQFTANPVQRGGHPAPTRDAGLVTLCHCLGLPLGSAATIFALGRSAGWVAHALEQR